MYSYCMMSETATLKQKIVTASEISGVQWSVFMSCVLFSWGLILRDLGYILGKCMLKAIDQFTTVTLPHYIFKSKPLIVRPLRSCSCFFFCSSSSQCPLHQCPVDYVARQCAYKHEWNCNSETKKFQLQKLLVSNEVYVSSDLFQLREVDSKEIHTW